MNWKLKHANFDEISGISTVTIQTELGEFTGKAVLHEEDRDLISNFIGCKYAELRAAAKYGKALIRIQKTKVNTLKNLINNLDLLKDYDVNTKEARFIRKTYYIELKKLNQWKKNLANLS